MSVVKRSIYFIKRNFYKAIATSMVVFLMGTLVTLLYFALNFIDNANFNVQQRLRPIVTFTHDYTAMMQSWEEAGGYWIISDEEGISVKKMGREDYFPRPEQLTADIIDTLISDSRVDSYQKRVTIAFETDFVEYLPEGATGTTFSSGIVNEKTQQPFENLVRYNINIIQLEGSSNDFPLEFSEGLIELSQGFDLTRIDTEQIENQRFPLLLSENFARENNFVLGSAVKLTFHVYNTEGNWITLDNPTWEDVIDSTLTFDFLVTGLFQVIPNERENPDFPWVEPNRQRVLENMFFTSYDAILDIWNKKLTEVEVDFSPNLTLLLSNPTELQDFIDCSIGFLPNYWTVNYITRGFENVVSTLNNIDQNFHFIFRLILISIVLVLSLIYIYNMSRRKLEIGIYVVLGDRKSNIYLQIVLEALLISIFPLILSLVSGTLISQEVVNRLIILDLISSMEDSGTVDVLNVGANQWSELGFDEILTESVFLQEQGIVNLLQTVTVSFLVVIGIVIAASALSVMFLMRQSPKKLLEALE